MAALTQDRCTEMRDGRPLELLVAADTEIFAGSFVAIQNGYAIPAKVATGLVAAGRAESHVDNSDGLAGAKAVEVMPGLFPWANSAGADEITQADVGATAYLVDDQTVAKTAGIVEAAATRSAAGTIVGLENGKVWVATKAW